MKTMADLVSSEGLIPTWCLFTVSTSGEKDKLGLWDLFYKESNFNHCQPNNLPQTPMPNIITLRVISS